MTVFSAVCYGEHLVLMLGVQLTVIHIVHAIQRVIRVVDDEWPPEAVAVLSEVV